MLTLRRRAKQSLLIGDDIEIHVAKVEGGVVTVDIIAPRNVRVDRKERRVELEAKSLSATSEEKRR